MKLEKLMVTMIRKCLGRDGNMTVEEALEKAINLLWEHASGLEWEINQLENALEAEKEAEVLKKTNEK